MQNVLHVDTEHIQSPHSRLSSNPHVPRLCIAFRPLLQLACIFDTKSILEDFPDALERHALDIGVK